MLPVKTRKQGNSLTITIPKSFEIEANKEYYAIKKENGSLVYIPVIQDFFENAEQGEFYENEYNYRPVGAEQNYD